MQFLNYLQVAPSKVENIGLQDIRKVNEEVRRVIVSAGYVQAYSCHYLRVSSLDEIFLVGLLEE